MSGTVKVGPVAARYANALYELASEKGQLEPAARDVERLAALLGDPDESGWLFDARVPAREKRERIERLAATLSPLAGNFVRLLADKRRLELLPELPEAFKRCVLRGRGAVEGEVASARPLGAGELAELSVALGGLLKKQVTLHPRVEPALLAGARVTVDNRLLDASALGRLEGLRNRLDSARIH